MGRLSLSPILRLGLGWKLERKDNDVEFCVMEAIVNKKVVDQICKVSWKESKLERTNPQNVASAQVDITFSIGF